MAKGIYVGASKEGTLVNFVSNPAPIIWTNSSDGKTATGANDYGNWEVVTTNGTSSYPASQAVDGDTSTYWAGLASGSDTETSSVQLYLPDGVSIKPTQITVDHGYCGNTSNLSKLIGYTTDGEEVELGTLKRQTNNATNRSETFTITGDKYYTSFKLLLYRYSNSYVTQYIHDFKIDSGTLKLPIPQNNIARKVKKAYVGVAEDSLVANGDFSNGLDSWIDTNNKYKLTLATDNSNKYMIAELVTPSASTSSTEITGSQCAVVQNNIYYMKIDVHGETSNGAITVNFGIKGTDINYYPLGFSDAYNKIEWTTYSKRFTSATSGKGLATISMNIQNSSGTLTAGMKMYIDNLALYDLTAMFGAGNEPTKEWCDANLEALKTLYKSKNSKARKVKKGYIGVGGVARPFFSAEQKLEYYGTADTLSYKRQQLAATSVGDYALFGGGYDGNDGSGQDRVDTYTSSLVKGTATNLSGNAYCNAATTVGNYALFAGGRYSSSVRATVDTYTSSLVKGTATNLSVRRQQLAATSVGNYALFGGGNTSGGSTSCSAVVDTYTSSLVKSTATSLSVARMLLAATTVGGYALFAGGYDGSAGYSAVVDTYTSSLVKGVADNLSQTKQKLAATTVGGYALFAGGYNGSNLKTVDGYDANLVKRGYTALSASRQQLAATSVGDYALFGGGVSGSNYHSAVDAYDTNLTKSTATALSVARMQLAATSVGDYALFGGGSTSDTGTAKTTVDAYQVI